MNTQQRETIQKGKGNVGSFGQCMYGYDIQFFTNESKGNERQRTQMELPRKEWDFYSTILQGLRKKIQIQIQIKKH